MQTPPTTSMQRLLRIRQLEEDLAIQELESCLLSLKRLEDRQISLVHWRANLGEEGLRALNSGESAIWQAGETEKLWSRGMEEELRGTLKKAREQLSDARERLLEKRTARRTVETLVEEEARKARYRQEKREQQNLDEWFQMTASSRVPGR